MAKRNPADRAQRGRFSPDPKDKKVERAVLAFLIYRYPERLTMADELVFTASSERVERVSSMRWGALLLEETRVAAAPSEEAQAALFQAARTDVARFLRSEAALTLAARVSLLGEHFPDAGFAADPAVALEQALLAACAGAVSFAELDRADLPSLYVAGLGEFAYRNGIDLDVEVTGGVTAPPPARTDLAPGAPLVPFGGGIDSIVTVEALRASGHEPTLFVVGGGADINEAIAGAAAVTGRPMLRASRTIDPQVRRSAEWLLAQALPPMAQTCLRLRSNRSARKRPPR